MALTGTPGTGKSSAGIILMKQGLQVIELGDLAKRHGLLREMDEGRGSYDIDPTELQDAVDSLERAPVSLLVGHMSHLMEVDMIVILRCRPTELKKRLTSRGWNKDKVQENIEAEALDVILSESMDQGVPVYEIDTTDIGVEETVSAIIEILNGKTDKYHAGNIDWSEEVLQWY